MYDRIKSSQGNTGDEIQYERSCKNERQGISDDAHGERFAGYGISQKFGNGTINILRIRNSMVIEDSLHTEMLGVNECVKEILHSLKDKTFTNVDESVALDFIKTGESSISEVFVDEMKRIISIYCGKVMKLLTRNGYNRDFMNLYICGGGARVMKKFCPAVANDDKVFLMTNICATAKGYELMAEKMLRDQYEKQ